MGVTISSYSLITTIVLYNLALILIYILRKRNLLLIRHGEDVLLFITLLSVIRLLSPVDFLRAYVIQSEKLVPTVKSAFELQPFSSVINLSVGHFVLLAWLMGICCFALKYIFSVYKAMHLRKSYVLTRNEQADRAVKRLDVKAPVLVSAQVITPYTAGFFRPVIYLPDLDLSDETWEYILRHETQHIQSRDMLIKLFYAVIEVVMWWNPVSHLFMRELDAMLELRCDAALAAGLSENERLEYLEAILHILKSANTRRQAQMSVYFAQREQYMRERFDAILNIRKRTDKRARFVVIAVALVIFCSSYFVVIQPTYRPPLDESAGMSINDEEAAVDQFILFDGEKYCLYVDKALYKYLSIIDLAKEPYNTLPIYG